LQGVQSQAFCDSTIDEVIKFCNTDYRSGFKQAGFHFRNLDFEKYTFDREEIFVNIPNRTVFDEDLYTIEEIRGRIHNTSLLL
jgi:hypothetical protein